MLMCSCLQAQPYIVTQPPIVRYDQLVVIVVDDEPANQRVAARFLKGLGVTSSNIVVFGDGEPPC